MLAWVTYYGAALAALKRAHIGFPGFVNALPPRWRVPAVWFGEACVIGFFGLLTWFGFKVLTILTGDTSNTAPSSRSHTTHRVLLATLMMVTYIPAIPLFLVDIFYK